MTFAVTGILV